MRAKVLRHCMKWKCMLWQYYGIIRAIICNCQLRSSTGSQPCDQSTTALFGSRFPYKSSYLLKLLRLRADFAISTTRFRVFSDLFRMPDTSDTHYKSLQSTRHGERRVYLTVYLTSHWSGGFSREIFVQCTCCLSAMANLKTISWRRLQFYILEHYLSITWAFLPILRLDVDFSSTL